MMILGATVAVCTPGLAQAGSNGDFGIGVSGGTLGIGGDLSWRVNSGFSVSAGYSGYSVSKGFSESGVEYSGKLDLRNIPVFLNWHPFGGSFRLAAGAVFQDSRARGSATPTAPVELGGVTYDPAVVGSFTLSGDARFANSTMPYLGLGWTGRFGESSWGGFVDAGVMFTGSTKVRLSSSNAAVAQSDLQAESASVQDGSQISVYPVLRFGITYNF